MTTVQPFIGIVQGDACGIGPELLSKLLRKLKAAERNRSLRFILSIRGISMPSNTPDSEDRLRRLDEPFDRMFKSEMNQ